MRDSQELIAAVRAQVLDLLPVDASEVQSTTDLLSLGAHSFDFVNLVFKLETAFGIKMPRRYAIPAKHTIAAYARAVAKQLAGPSRRQAHETTTE
jgi:acyl carrier protein